MELDLEPISLLALTQEVIGQFEAQLDERSVKLVPELPASVPNMQADKTKFKQVLINLIGNAIKFTEEGTVTVRLSLDLDTQSPARLDIIDTGIGIPEDRIDTVFDPFKQCDSSISRRYGGTGLGLAISRSMCQLMGFRLVASSQSGEGSTFSILLMPEMSTVEQKSIDIAQQTELLSQYTGRTRELSVPRIAPLVLIIDDEADSRLMLSHHLEELNCQVLETDSGLNGIQLAQKFQPDLILIDLMMPDVGGWETLRQLKSNADVRDIPAVVVSIIATEQRSSLSDAVAFLDKPVTLEELVDVLAHSGLQA